jgi:hypothetical protein
VISPTLWGHGFKSSIGVDLKQNKGMASKYRQIWSRYEKRWSTLLMRILEKSGTIFGKSSSEGKKPQGNL